MKQIILIILTFFIIKPLSAAIVEDEVTGLPLSKASIFDKKGRIIGICSDNGVLPYLNAADYPISISYLGYESATILKPGVEKIRLKPLSIELPELYVDSKNSQVLYMSGYVREYSTMVTNEDTVFLFREKNVDFMVPTKKVKKFNGWSLPRILFSKSYYHFTNNDGLDSVSDYYPNHFSWSDWIGIIPSTQLPQKLKYKELASDTIYAKYGISSIWQKNDESVSLNLDVLAAEDNRKWVPGMNHFLNNGVDFTLFNLRYEFTDVMGDEIFPDNIARISYNIQANGNNRFINRLGNKVKPVYMDTYAEIYITDREYISISEAKKIEKKLAENFELEKMENVPALTASIQDLVARVNDTDNEMVRLHREADKRLAGRELKGEKYKYGVFPFISRAIKKLGFQF